MGVLAPSERRYMLIDFEVIVVVFGVGAVEAEPAEAEAEAGEATSDEAEGEVEGVTEAAGEALTEAVGQAELPFLQPVTIKAVKANATNAVIFFVIMRSLLWSLTLPLNFFIILNINFVSSE
jgi:hypothetical protein